MPNRKKRFSLRVTESNIWEPVADGAIVLYNEKFAIKPKRYIVHHKKIERGMEFLNVAYDKDRVLVASVEDLQGGFEGWTVLGAWSVPQAYFLLWRFKDPLKL